MEVSEAVDGFGVGMPANLLLDQWGYLVYLAFGEYPYLVGSALRTKKWRDVDVRLILPDEKYDALFGTRDKEFHNPRWTAMCVAFSMWAKEATGLPVDFQFQRQTEANAQHRGKGRSACGLLVFIQANYSERIVSEPTGEGR